MKKTLIAIVALTLLTGCSQAQPGDSTSVDTADSNNSVVTSFYPLQYLAQQLLPEEVEVINLTGAKDPHSYELTPKDLQKLTEADLFVFQGANLESWAEQVEEQREEAGTPNFEVAHKVELMEYKEEGHDDHHDEDNHDEHEDEHHDEEHHDDHDDDHHDNHEGEEDHKEDDHHGHDHGSHDPHTWLDPALHSETASALATELKAIYPQYEEQITTNLKSLQENLTQLDQNYIAALQSCENPQAISSHDAFSYQEAKYNFQLFPIAGLAPQDEPTPAKLAEIIQLAEKEQITSILQEEFNNQSFSDTIKAEANLDVIKIHTLESTPEDKDYIQVLEDNLASLKQAFNCQ